MEVFLYKIQSFCYYLIEDWGFNLQHNVKEMAGIPQVWITNFAFNKEMKVHSRACHKNISLVNDTDNILHKKLKRGFPASTLEKCVQRGGAGSGEKEIFDKAPIPSSERND